MKLRMHPWSLNGQALAPDEFGYRVPSAGNPSSGGGAGFNPAGIDAIEFRCPNGAKKQCQVHLTLGAQTDGPPRRWHWDGNMQEPTITPSIGCEARCGWHGNIVAGEPKP